jgi:hypothetical protein
MFLLPFPKTRIELKGELLETRPNCGAFRELLSYAQLNKRFITFSLRFHHLLSVQGTIKACEFEGS